MAASLFTALSALKAHQSWIDVIGNNLANASTPGYKSNTATFSSQLSQTLRFASEPSGNVGGRNPVQLGSGVQLSDVGRYFGQGALSSTGRTFDLAMEGNGFFALDNGGQMNFTRVGSFGVDADSNLVDRRTGFRVLGGDSQPVVLDLDSPFPPNATSQLQLFGNLPAVVTGPLQEELTSTAALAEGSSAVLTGANAGPFTIPAGETWTMEISLSGAQPETVSIVGTGAPMTTATIAASIDAIDGLSAADVGGAVEIISDRTGEDASLRITPGDAGQDLAAMLGLPTSLVRGSETAVSGTTDLNLLPANVTDYVNGDLIELSGVDTDGTPVSASFTYGVDGTTVDDLIAFADGLYADATVSLNADGEIIVTADTAGEAALSLVIGDGTGSGQVGGTQWANHALTVSTQGTGPDQVTTTGEVFDMSGTAHTLTIDLERQQDGTWTLTPALDESEGQVTSAPITGLTFDDNGAPIGIGTQEVTVTFTGQNAVQTVALELGDDGQLTGLTQYGSEANVWTNNVDGYGVGDLVNITVGGSGEIQGFYGNGQVRTLGDLGVVTFANAEGLHEVGENLYTQSANSGAIVINSGDVGGAGRVVQGALENSNVDTAEQFVRLIEAQRGFQANARVISTQDEILAELVNIL